MPCACMLFLHQRAGPTQPFIHRLVLVLGFGRYAWPSINYKRVFRTNKNKTLRLCLEMRTGGFDFPSTHKFPVGAVVNRGPPTHGGLCLDGPLPRPGSTARRGFLPTTPVWGGQRGGGGWSSRPRRSMRRCRPPPGGGPTPPHRHLRRRTTAGPPHTLGPALALAPPAHTPRVAASTPTAHRACLAVCVPRVGSRARVGVLLIPNALHTATHVLPVATPRRRRRLGRRAALPVGGRGSVHVRCRRVGAGGGRQVRLRCPRRGGGAAVTGG